MDPTPMESLEEQVASLAASLASHRVQNQDIKFAAEEIKALELLHKIRQSAQKVKGGDESAAIMDRIMRAS